MRKHKIKAIINPLEGIILDDKKILLGMSKSEVISLLGNADIWENCYYYFDSDLAIDFDESDKVQFIDFLGGKNGCIKPYIYGMAAFDSDADDLVEVLKSHNNDRIDYDENGYAYNFNEISIGISRESTPEGVQRDIEEMKADGEYDQDYVDSELELARHWATIGMGSPNYYG